MDLFDAIAQRYCYRGQYTDDAVPREDLAKIVRRPPCETAKAMIVCVTDPG